MIEALIGAALGVLTIVVARAIRGERWLYAMWAMRTGDLPGGELRARGSGALAR